MHHLVSRCVRLYYLLGYKATCCSDSGCVTYLQEQAPEMMVQDLLIALHAGCRRGLALGTGSIVVRTQVLHLHL